MTRIPARAVLSLSALALLITGGLLFAGPLDPPAGPVGSTYKTLTEVEPRIAINAANIPGNATNTFIIGAPGSYYLTGNITGAPGKHGISVQANDVTIDLNGFALTGGGGGAFRGINVPVAQKNLCIRDGTVRDWTDGGVRTDLATSTLAENLRLSDNTGATGLALGNGLAKNCVATGNATGFVVGNGAEIKDCVATANTTGFSTADRAMLSSCIATENTGIGFSCASYVTLLDCAASRNFGAAGIVVLSSSTVTRSSASNNIPAGTGILAGADCIIADCIAGNNALDGIDVGDRSTVRNCTTSVNVHGIRFAAYCTITGNTSDANNRGVYTEAGGSRVDGNTCSRNITSGFLINGVRNVVICNSAHGNGTDYNIVAGSAAGPVVNVSAGGTITSTNPWANFLH